MNRPTTPWIPPRATLTIPSALGIGIAFRSERGFGMVPFLVNDVQIHENYADFFRQADGLLEQQEARVRLVITGERSDADETKTYTLFYDGSDGLVVPPESHPTTWSEFSLSAKLRVSQDDAHLMPLRSGLVVTEGQKRPLTVTDQSAFHFASPSPSLGEALTSLATNHHVPLDTAERILIEGRQGMSNWHTLLVFSGPSERSLIEPLRKWCAKKQEEGEKGVWEAICSLV